MKDPDACEPSCSWRAPGRFQIAELAEFHYRRDAIGA